VTAGTLMHGMRHPRLESRGKYRGTARWCDRRSRGPKQQICLARVGQLWEMAAAFSHSDATNSVDSLPQGEGDDRSARMGRRRA